MQLLRYWHWSICSLEGQISEEGSDPNNKGNPHICIFRGRLAIMCKVLQRTRRVSVLLFINFFFVMSSCCVHFDLSKVPIKFWMYLTCCLNIWLISAPHPSKKCQQQFGQLCVKDNQLASEFLNGLLNQLNWSFSEFIGMLQEVGQFQNTSDLGCWRHQIEICRVKP